MSMSLQGYLQFALRRPQVTNIEIAGQLGISRQQYSNLVRTGTLTMDRAAQAMRAFGLSEVDVTVGLVELGYLDRSALRAASRRVKEYDPTDD